LWRRIVATKAEEIVRTDKYPASEVREPSRQPPTRTSEAKGHLQVNESSAAFRFEVPKRVCSKRCRNFKSAALPTCINHGASILRHCRRFVGGVAGIPRHSAIEFNVRLVFSLQW
jgi:hypothetical protein